MSTEEIQALLERCDPVHLDLYGGGEDQREVCQADAFLPNPVESRKIQKILSSQLCVLNDMMGLLEKRCSPDELLNESCPPNPGSEAHSRWNTLKAQYREEVKQVETLIGTLQSKIDQLHLKRGRLTQLVSTLEEKRETSVHLECSLQMAREALHLCEGQLAQARQETETVVNRLGAWQLHKDELQACVSATEGVMQYSLLSVSQSELCLELRPRLYGSSSSHGQLEPLKLTVTWSHDDRFCLQMCQGTAGMPEECVRGRVSELSAALLDVLQRYSSQGEMLAEIQSLHSRFAIDWRPAKRQLVFLKSSSVVCTLEVEEGYPSRGRATLLSVRRDTGLVESCHLQHPKGSPSLTEWLIFLSCNDNI
ncbi:uncharacterized protein si:dkey-225f5.4 [Osmerus mordax]|uniref:uncharacterized protein si:dkey-225f5.4 n=1 Tax=Osmerus mordax TaxID=8014 RepID=UPI003510C855